MGSILIPDEKALGVLSSVQKVATDRRTFLKLAGISVALMAAGCSSSSDSTPTQTVTPVDLGSGDTGILNYAYALEQLEAAFYIRVTDPNDDNSYYKKNATAQEKLILADIRDHEIAHREFFKAALGASAIQSLEVNFDKINFSDRASVLGAAQTFEDLGVAAYNGAGRLLTSADNLLIAGKIVSVEARHASAIRDLLQPKTGYFAGDDVVNGSGFDKALTPSVVLTTAAPYLKTTLNGANLPSA